MAAQTHLAQSQQQDAHLAERVGLENRLRDVLEQVSAKSEEMRVLQAEAARLRQRSAENERLQEQLILLQQQSAESKNDCIELASLYQMKEEEAVRLSEALQ